MVLRRTEGLSTIAADVSDDGRFVAFLSQATNLDAGRPPLTLCTTSTSATWWAHDSTLASRASGVAGAKANGDSGLPDISSDGGEVAFVNAGTNLHAHDTDTSYDLLRPRPSARERRLVTCERDQGRAPGRAPSPAAHPASACGSTCTTGVAGRLGQSTSPLPPRPARRSPPGPAATRWWATSALVTVSAQSQRQRPVHRQRRAQALRRGRSRSTASKKTSGVRQEGEALRGRSTPAPPSTLRGGLTTSRSRRRAKSSNSYVGSGSAPDHALGRFKLQGQGDQELPSTACWSSAASTARPPRRSR